MYRFQINAQTRVGESIGLVGSAPELGQWDVSRCVPLCTSADRYPLWWTETEVDFQSHRAHQDIEYKYVRLGPGGSVHWESLGSNRWIAIDPDYQSLKIILDDGDFGQIRPYPFGYLDPCPEHQSSERLKIVVIGSSVALGFNAWLLRGWAWLLGHTLQQNYGHQLINVSEVGANVSRTIERFQSVVAPEKPDMVIIALSLGNEGLAECLPQEQRTVQRRFESGLHQLIKMTRELGAFPILGGVYPNGKFTPEHYGILLDTHNRMLTWEVPVLNWLAALDNGQGQWKTELVYNPTHPNTLGHRYMAQAIDSKIFALNKEQLAQEKQRFCQPNEVSIYLDDQGFQILTCIEVRNLRIINPSPHSYTIVPSWQDLQTALQQHAHLIPGVYIAKNAFEGIAPSFAVHQDRTIETTLNIPPGTNLEYSAALNFFAPNTAQLLFYDGHLGLLKEDEQHIRIINESDHVYSIQPMWQEVRSALKAMPLGVYTDPLYPDRPFYTMMIGPQGLESRVKVAARSAVLFHYQGPLSAINRVAIIPLGDRCAIRMLLYKMEYDGPAFPFDLTRSTNIGDVADMIATGFQDMWNPYFLRYDYEAGRIYHTKWTGLSFAHEVEKTDDPLNDMTPVWKRIYTRYKARSERFWHTLRHCNKALFIRTGIVDRGGVRDLVYKLENQCYGKPFLLLVISPQPSHEFADLPKVLHYNQEFNPDRMYEDLAYWMRCTEALREILESLGVSSKNLFWCPP